MTDAQLRSALIEIRDYELGQLPEEEWNYEFSSRFQRKMEQLIKREKHPVTYHVRRFAAALFIALGVIGGMVFAFNAEVRAEVIRWIMEQFSENGYRYQNEVDTEVDVSKYTLEGIVPEEYQLVDRNEGEESIIEAYVRGDGSLLTFSVMRSTKSEEFIISFDSGIRIETTYVNGNKADLYLPEDSNDSSVIVWQGSNGALFSIMAIMDKEQLIKIAEGIE